MSRLSSTLLLATIAMLYSAQAFAGPSVYAISAEAVTRAVLLAHPELAGDAIELTTRIETRTDAPVLEAGLLEHMATPSALGTLAPSAPLARVRLRCHTSSACLPFYALIHLASSDPSEIASAALAQPRSQEQHLIPTTARAGTPMLRTGAHAFMVIDSGLLHIRVPVTCLENGNPGATIRVAGLPRGRVYRAAIVDGATVRGSL